MTFARRGEEATLGRLIAGPVEWRIGDSLERGLGRGPFSQFGVADRDFSEQFFSRRAGLQPVIVFVELIRNRLLCRKRLGAALRLLNEFQRSRAIIQLGTRSRQVQ